MHKKWLILLLAIFCLLAALAAGLAWRFGKNAPFGALFDGFRLDRISHSEKSRPAAPTIGVMIENELTSRPFQKGLAAAAVVYEAPAEGNITRFLALFRPESLPKKIGPVRSARPYFLDWMHEYGGVYAHVGGSDEALRRLRKEDLYDTDEFQFGRAVFWRENVGKTALEHTAFTSGDALRKLIKKEGWILRPRTEIITLSRNDLADFANAEMVKKIELDFGWLSSRVQYEYDDALGKWLRFQAGKPHLDKITGNQIAVPVIVIQRVKAWSLGDSAGRLAIQTIGSGEATIFRGNIMKKALWKKENLKSPTRFYDENGKIFDITSWAGEPLWIEILPEGNSFTVLGAAADG